MTIERINQEQMDKILKIQKEHPLLTYQAKGYDTPDRTKWSEDDANKFKEVEDILKKHIVGFESLQNFVISRKGEIGLRLQYDYQADLTGEERSKTKLGYFKGVGYITLRELMNGFD